MLNVYKILAKKHHVVDSCSADKAPILETLFWKDLEYDSLILPNCKKKLKRTTIVRIKISSILTVQQKLVLVVE